MQPAPPPAPPTPLSLPLTQQYHSFNLSRYEDIHLYRDRLHRQETQSQTRQHSQDQSQSRDQVGSHKDPAYQAFLQEIGRNTIGPSGVRALTRPSVQRTKYLCDIDLLQTDVPSAKAKVERKYFKLDVIEPNVPRVYEAMSKCSNDADSINSFKSDGSNKNFIKPAVIKKTTPNHYVDMAKALKELAVVAHSSKEMLLDKEKVYNRPLQDNSNRMQSVDAKSTDKVARRHTTEYRGPPQLVLPPMKNDSSDSAEKSPVATHTSKHPYPYLVLTEQRLTKKKNSITSSTSEENSDAITAAIKLRMQGKEWRENKAPKRIDSLTVDRRSSKKHQAKSAKMKRQGSFNIDPAGEFHLSLDVGQTRDISVSVRSCNPAKSPLMDARKTPLQISAEDMVQIANCGARNKNGSLCHFISANTDNYLSISQALLNQSSGSEAKLTEMDSLPRKHHTAERKKKSTHSLAFESSDETLCQQDKHPVRRQDNMLPKYRDIDTKNDTVERRHKGHSRQRSHDLEKTVKSAKYRQDSTPGRKLVHTKSEGQRGRIPAGYFLLEDENGHTVPLQLGGQREGKYSAEKLDCKCVLVSTHSLAKADKGDFSSGDAEPVFRRLGASSREELATTSGGDVEESFDF